MYDLFEINASRCAGRAIPEYILWNIVYQNKQKSQDIYCDLPTLYDTVFKHYKNSIMNIKLILVVFTSVIFLTGCGSTTTSRLPGTSTGLAAEDLWGEPEQTPPDQALLYSSGSSTITFSPNPPSETVPSMEFNVSQHYTAILHTNKGDIEIALNFGQTPNTVKNFVDLSRKGFYINTIFHRVIDGFMIQGGDPEGTGMGGPGYRFDDEPFTGEYTRGAVAMANAGPNTNGSQFFIMHADYPLPKNYTIFGHVTKGIEVVDAIATDEVQYSPTGELSVPVTPTVVHSIEIIES